MVPVALIYLGALGAATLGGLCGFAYKGVRESSEAARKARVRARTLALFLANRRGQYMAFQMSDGKEVTGFVAIVDVEDPVLFLDVRKAELKGSALRPKGKTGVPSDLVTVDLSEVTEVTSYSGLYDEHIEDDEDDDNDEYSGRPHHEWGD